MKLLFKIVVGVFLWTTAATVHGQSSTPTAFTLSKATEIPGSKLHPGSYTLAVLDSLTDRTVMQMNSSDGKVNALLLGVPANLSGAAGPSYWDAKEQGRHALRGFVFADGRSVEFVYPKADAVALAKANHSSVVAVDPASEGRPELNRLSSRDMQMVNLWLLTPTRVSGQQALEAKHYEPAATGASQTQVAAQAPAGNSAQQSSSGSASQVAASTDTYAGQTPSSSRKPTAVSVRRPSRAAAPNPNLQASAEAAPAGIRTLPQTGSTLPLWFLLTSVSLSGAAVVRLRRQAHVVAE